MRVCKVLVVRYSISKMVGVCLVASNVRVHETMISHTCSYRLVSTIE